MDGINEKDEDTTGKSDKEVIARAKARYKACSDEQGQMREESLKQLKFRHGEQWPEDAKQSRGVDRPALTINRIPGFVHSITNDQRQNRPAINVNPVDENSDPAVAKIYQGLIRHIEYDSGADMAYDTAHDYAVTMGFGYIQIATEFKDSMSFDQDLKIQTIHDPFAIFLDHLHRSPDGSDANWCVKLMGGMSMLEFKQSYPGATAESFESLETLTVRNVVQPAEYYEITMKPTKIHRLQDGRVITHAQLTDQLKPYIHATRDSEIKAVTAYVLSGDEVLDKTDWPCHYIPIIPVYGTITYIEGKRVCYGLVKDLIDPARMYNYWVTTATETVALAPKPAYVVAEGQIDGYESDWSRVSVDRLAYRRYKPTSLNGQPVGPPQREQFAGIPSGMIQMLQLSADDMKVTTGIYDAGLGNRSNETSGVAITARQKESEVANFHYQDNMRRSLRHVGRILIEMIPRVIDTPRMVRILGEDDTPELVKLYEETQEGIKNNISIGKYDATVSTGPSFTTKRQEFVEASMQLASAIPEIWKVAGHIIIKAMQWPKADEIAELWKATFAPQTEQGDGQNEGLPPEVQQQMQMREQQLQELQGQLQQVTAQAEDKRYIEQLKARVQIEIEKMRGTNRMDVEEFKAAAQLIMQGMEPPQSWLVENQQEPNLDLEENTEGSAPAAPNDPAMTSGDGERQL